MVRRRSELSYHFHPDDRLWALHFLFQGRRSFIQEEQDSRETPALLSGIKERSRMRKGSSLGLVGGEIVRAWGVSEGVLPLLYMLENALLLTATAEIISNYSPYPLLFSVSSLWNVKPCPSWVISSFPINHDPVNSQCWFMGFECLVLKGKTHDLRIVSH